MFVVPKLVQLYGEVTVNRIREGKRFARLPTFG
jgi:hypothetical protein